MAFPYEIVAMVQQVNQHYAMQDRVIPVGERSLEFKKTGLRMTSTQRVVKIDFPVDITGKSKEYDPRSHR